MTDHFDASTEAFRDWLPYSGRHKNARTIEQYVTAAQRLAAWSRMNGRQDFAQLTKPDLRAFLSSLPGRDGGPATASSQATIWWAIRALVPVPRRGRGRPGHRQGDHGRAPAGR